jgi:hypothetical protein
MNTMQSRYPIRDMLLLYNHPSSRDCRALLHQSLSIVLFTNNAKSKRTMNYLVRK